MHWTVLFCFSLLCLLPSVDGILCTCGFPAFHICMSSACFLCSPLLHNVPNHMHQGQKESYQSGENHLRGDQTHPLDKNMVLAIRVQDSSPLVFVFNALEQQLNVIKILKLWADGAHSRLPFRIIWLWKYSKSYVSIRRLPGLQLLETES